jgi:hypothetical protein
MGTKRIPRQQATGKLANENQMEAASQAQGRHPLLASCTPDGDCLALRMVMMEGSCSIDVSCFN